MGALEGNAHGGENELENRGKEGIVGIEGSEIYRTMLRSLRASENEKDSDTSKFCHDNDIDNDNTNSAAKKYPIRRLEVHKFLVALPIILQSSFPLCPWSNAIIQ